MRRDPMQEILDELAELHRELDRVKVQLEYTLTYKQVMPYVMSISAISAILVAVLRQMILK